MREGEGEAIDSIPASLRRERADNSRAKEKIRAIFLFLSDWFDWFVSIVVLVVVPPLRERNIDWLNRKTNVPWAFLFDDRWARISSRSIWFYNPKSLLIRRMMMPVVDQGPAHHHGHGHQTFYQAVPSAAEGTSKMQLTLILPNGVPSVISVDAK